MKITGYKVLIILGILILHNLPFLVYFYAKTDSDKVFGIAVTLLINLFVIGLSEIYNDIFLKIHKQMKKEIKLW